MKTMNKLSSMLRNIRNLKYMLIAMPALLVTSCIDTVVLPIEKTIEEDYWKNKDDVSGMVTGAYKQLNTVDVMRRLLVWGELRGDNVNPNEDMQSNSMLSSLMEVNTLNLDDKNTYDDWSAIYSIINKCNLVLDKAPGVMSIDPQYTRGVFQTDRSQMLALRALAYFYLVRAYRDVPYVATAYSTSSQDMEVAQLAPVSVLSLCIKDLEEAAPIALSPASYPTGLLTSEGVRALLADVYLWRASLNHNDPTKAARNRSDYQRCADLCEQVVNAKAARIKQSMNNTERMKNLYNEDLGLLRGSLLYGEVFGKGNSIESIFELQFDGDLAVNTAVCEMYWEFAAKTTPGYLVAAQPFGTTEKDKVPVSTSNVFFTNNDYRFWTSCFAVDNATAESFNVRKMVATSTAEVMRMENLPAVGRLANDENSYNKYAQNWIFYRTSDLLLMRAEALVQLAATGATFATDDNLLAAAQLVKEVSNRSLSVLDDSIQLWRDYNDRDLMETLVLSERRRELCFEGKRWFDLMRYAFRHMTGIDATKKMSEQHVAVDAAGNATGEANAAQFPAVPNELLTLVKAKYRDGGAALSFQLNTEPKMYFPILESELKVNANLKQNPGFRTTGGEYQKNY